MRACVRACVGQRSSGSGAGDDIIGLGLGLDLGAREVLVLRLIWRSCATAKFRSSRVALRV